MFVLLFCSLSPTGGFVADRPLDRSKKTKNKPITKRSPAASPVHRMPPPQSYAYGAHPYQGGYYAPPQQFGGAYRPSGYGASQSFHPGLVGARPSQGQFMYQGAQQPYQGAQQPYQGAQQPYQGAQQTVRGPPPLFF
jgi:hypothetical protein